MTTITDRIKTTVSPNNSAVIFATKDTPNGAGDGEANAYSTLKSAVYNARGYEDVSMIDIDNMPTDVEFGSATFDTETGEVTDLEIDDRYLNEFGY